MGEAKITRRGGVGAAERTAVPTLTLVEKDAFSITITFTNNDDEEATIFYGLTTPPDDDSVVLASNATSSNITFSGLDDDTQYTIFAYALVTDPISKKIKSEITAIQVTTDKDLFAIFTDTSGSPGATFPINDLDGNPMLDEAKGIAYYGTVSHTDLYKADEFSSLIGVTAGTGSSDGNIDEEAVWHKYYWNGGIHFWRKPIRHSVSWNAIWEEGAVFGTGTDTSRKGYKPTNFNGPNLTGINQNAEVTKNGVTYAVRLMEGGNVDPYVEADGSTLHNSEFTLILMNLHAATNSGSYSGSPTDGVSYANWTDTANYTNDDFVGWKTNLGDADFTVTGNGRAKWQQETSSTRPERRLRRGDARLSTAVSFLPTFDVALLGWAPVLTVKHSSFTYE